MICCKQFISPLLTYEIGNSGDLLFAQDDLKLPILPETDIDLLKEKVICEFTKIISDLEMGIQTDLEFLLEEISVIALDNEILDNREFIVQYYLNNNG